MSTTLEILAPYLPYAIEVEWKHGQARHYELTGLVTQTSTCYLEGKYSAFAEDLRPALRPFSQLADLLPDGTVPAVEVAKMVLDLSLAHCDAEYLAGIEAHMDMHGDCGVYLPDCGGASVNIYNDWLISAKDAMTPPSVYDYLRSKHFAVGLQPGQYIEKSPLSPL